MRPLDYHDATKHHFHRFARSRGYLDWATQPDPFRRFDGSPLVELPRIAYAGARPAPPSREAIGELLRCALGLSAWKQFGASRWALRVNPSSGNLHPTEGYVAWGGTVAHYAPAEHALEERCAFDAGAWRQAIADDEVVCLVGVSSIHWREAWKYGERAFRYCQHDAGHAIAALRIAAALLGWRLRLLPRWAHADVAALFGLDRDDDFAGAEREEPECVAVVSRGGDTRDPDPRALLPVVARGRWRGRANRLSPDHVPWAAIDRVAEATRFPGVETRGGTPPPDPVPGDGAAPPYSRPIVLQRRSALGFDASSSLPKAAFLRMLDATVPPAIPWDAVWWPPQIHLALFVHRVDDLLPGIYAFARGSRQGSGGPDDDAGIEPFRAACREEFLWEAVAGASRLFLLAPLDCRRLANRLSCDQDIAADGFFSLGMLARFEPALRERGDWFYRHLFWESGLIGQVLYLEAEAAGARATGIGCFYDDPVHEVLGLRERQWQSLYHFSAGVPVEDTRLTTEPGYRWETGPS